MRNRIGRLGGGLLCLAAAALLLVLVLTRPEGTVVFVINDINRPFVPIVGLAVLGIALLVYSGRR